VPSAAAQFRKHTGISKDSQKLHFSPGEIVASEIESFEIRLFAHEKFLEAGTLASELFVIALRHYNHSIMVTAHPLWSFGEREVHEFTESVFASASRHSIRLLPLLDSLAVFDALE